MRYGVSVCPEVGRYKDARQQIVEAERLGFDSAFLPEHHLMPEYVPSPLLGLAAFASITNRISLGTDVVLAPFYHPVRLAEDAAVLSDISNGRFILGLGIGYREEEFAAFGVDMRQRGNLMDEYVEIIRRLLTSEKVSFSGNYCQLNEVTVYPRPSRPIKTWIGGWSPPALRRAAKKGDAWFPGPTADLDKLRQCLAIYDQALRENERKRSELPVFREVWVGTTEEELGYGIDRLYHMYYGDYLSWGHANVASGDSSQSLSFEDLERDRFIIGRPERVAEEIVRFAKEIGMDHIVARMHFHGAEQKRVLRSMELFADRVIPEVRKELS